MAGTSAGNRKSAATTKKKYGLTPDGKSLQHSEAGKRGAEMSEGLFARLKREDPNRLKAISQRGNAIMNQKAKAKRAFEGGINIDEA